MTLSLAFKKEYITDFHTVCCIEYRNLIKLRRPGWVAFSLANARAYWHIAGDSSNSALTNAYWDNPGLMSQTKRYCEIKYYL